MSLKIENYFKISNYNIVMMNKSKPIPKPRSTIVKFEGVNCKKHPIYDSFAAAANGQSINLMKKQLINTRIIKAGYTACNIWHHGNPETKTYLVHRFVGECFNGPIPEGMMISHINDNKDDNRFCNLQFLMKQQQNKKISDKKKKKSC